MAPGGSAEKAAGYPPAPHSGIQVFAGVRPGCGGGSSVAGASRAVLTRGTVRSRGLATHVSSLSPICYAVSVPMAKPTKPPLRAKRPRAEVQEEFSEIREEVESAKKTAEPKREESLRQQEADLRAAVGGLSVEGVGQQVSSLSLEISKALDGLS